MARLSNKDLARVHDLEQRLATLSETSQPILQAFVHDLRDLLGAEHAVSYAGAIGEDGPLLDFAYTAGFRSSTAAFQRDCNAWIRESGGRWALFDPVIPEPFQRNTVMPVGTFAQLVNGGRSGAMDIARLSLTEEMKTKVVHSLSQVETMLREWQIYRKYQVRMLVCDGPILLAWVGAFQSENYTAHQIRLFRRISNSLRFRLVLEARMQSAPIHQAGLEAALDAIPRAAYVVSKHGKLLHANAFGRATWRNSRANLPDIMAVIAGAPGYEVKCLERHGASIAYLIISTGQPIAQERLDYIQARFGLTPRQTQVVRSLLAGYSNKRIAHELGCSERTIEVHITKLFAKTNVSCRAELVAKVLA